MKKLLPLSVPIVLWIGNYPLWEFASQFMQDGPTVAGLWWTFTCMFFAGVTLLSVGWAILKITDY